MERKRDIPRDRIGLDSVASCWNELLEAKGFGSRIEQREGAGSNRRPRNYIPCSGRAAGLESHLAL